VADTVIYEAHVKGLTAASPARDPGTFLGLRLRPGARPPDQARHHGDRASAVHAFLTDRFLVEKGLTNYWGYQSLGFFAPDPRYLSRGRIAEFQQMVDRLHGRRDRGDPRRGLQPHRRGQRAPARPQFPGPRQRQLLPARTRPTARGYVNDTGTGNTVNVSHPMVLRMMMDSLRYWVEVMGVDGFRFDLCTTLGRTRSPGVRPGRGLLRRDPAGPGPDRRQADRRALGHRAGRLPAWARFRRPSWNGTTAIATACAVLARRRGACAGPCRPPHRLGAAVRPFGPRRPTSSVNF
jgi:isoamylase